MPVEEPLYPVNLRLRGVACLVVGGGPVPSARSAACSMRRPTVTVVAPDVVDELADWAGQRASTVERRPLRAGEAARYRLAITATGDPAVDGAVLRGRRGGRRLGQRRRRPGALLVHGAGPRSAGARCS